MYMLLVKIQDTNEIPFLLGVIFLVLYWLKKVVFFIKQLPAATIDVVNGEILQADINSENEKNLVKSVYEGHYGPIRALQHSPFFEDIILSIDVWTFSLWKERCVIDFRFSRECLLYGITLEKKPMFTSRSAEGYLTTGCWSPSRPGVIYIGLIDGIIEVWDLLDHSHQPSVKVSIGSCQVSSMEFSPTTSPQLLAVGDIQGILHIMQIPRRLSKMQYKEILK
eukprot:Gb_32613 [translate_table: standard]